MSNALDTGTVLALLQDVAEEVIRPRFRALTDDQISSKSHPADLVTVVDREAEELITARLHAAYPDAVILGEEAYAGTPSLIDAFRSADHAFTVDPVDGTRNFVDGSFDHAVMVAETKQGTTVRSWIWQPEHQRGYVAELGAGLWRDGVRVQREAPAADPAQWRVRTSRRASVGTMLGPAGPQELSWISCGIDYPKLTEGECDLLIYTGTMPWDHVPGALMLTETGGLAADRDGTAYRPRSEPEQILASASPEVLEQAIGWLPAR